MNQRIVMLIAFASVPLSGIASQNMDVSEALDYVGGELCECAAYNQIIATSVEGLENDFSKTLYTRSSKSAEYALTIASVFIDDEIANSRFRVSARLMLEEIDQDFSRISLLIDKYGGDCRTLLEDISGRIIELTR